MGPSRFRAFPEGRGVDRASDFVFPESSSLFDFECLTLGLADSCGAGVGFSSISEIGAGKRGTLTKNTDIITKTTQAWFMELNQTFQRSPLALRKNRF